MTLRLCKSAMALMLVLGFAAAAEAQAQDSQLAFLFRGRFFCRGFQEPPPLPPMPRAEDGVRLLWKFEKDRPFYQEIITETKQKLRVMGQDILQDQHQTIVFRFVPLEQDPKGNWRVNLKMVGIKLNIGIGGNKVNVYYYDDPGPSPPTPLDQFFRKLSEADFYITLGPDLTVLKIDGRKDFLDKLDPGTFRQPLDTLLSDDSFKSSISLGIGPFQGRRVSEGESWKSKSELNLGPIGKYLTTSRYTYLGLENQLDKVTVEISLQWLPPSKNPGPTSLPFNIKKGNLLSTAGSGYYLFDRAAGQGVRALLTQHLAGQLTIEVGGQETIVELDQTQTTTVRTTATNPLKK